MRANVRKLVNMAGIGGVHRMVYRSYVWSFLSFINPAQMVVSQEFLMEGEDGWRCALSVTGAGVVGFTIMHAGNAPTFLSRLGASVWDADDEMSLAHVDLALEVNNNVGPHVAVYTGGFARVGRLD